MYCAILSILCFILILFTAVEFQMAKNNWNQFEDIHICFVELIFNCNRLDLFRGNPNHQITPQLKTKFDISQSMFFLSLFESYGLDRIYMTQLL